MTDTAAGIPYEDTDCTADEAVEAVKAVRTTAAAEFLTALGGDVVIEDVAEPGPLPADAVMTTAEWWKRERRD